MSEPIIDGTYMTNILSINLIYSYRNYVYGLSSNRIIWLAGDSNAPYINWNTMSIRTC